VYELSFVVIPVVSYDWHAYICVHGGDGIAVYCWGLSALLPGILLQGCTHKKTTTKSTPRKAGRLTEVPPVDSRPFLLCPALTVLQQQLHRLELPCPGCIVQRCVATGAWRH
jgi:hypothetical protein